MAEEPIPAALVAVLAAPPNGELGSLPPGTGWLEVRADLVGDLDPDWLRDRFPGRLLYSLRSRAEGGAFEGSDADRRDRLAAAAGRGYDFIDLEARDLDPAVPAGRRVVSWHGQAETAADLRARFDSLARTGARLYRLVPDAASAAQGLAPLHLLRTLRRPDVTAFASGPAGAWTRLLAPRLGAPLAFGGTVPGSAEPAVAQLAHDYGLPALPPVEELFGIVGTRIAKSLSPRLHNAAYRALGVPALYLPFYAESFSGFWEDGLEDGLAALGMPLRGLTVTAPHKEAALGAAATASLLARRSGGANTLVRREGRWHADTADAEGVVAALKRRGVPLAGVRAAVVGCGGAGRAAAAGLCQAGAEVTLVNRGQERGELAAGLLDLPLVPLAEFDAGEFPLVVHATPLAAEPPFAVERLREGAVAVELVYGAARSPLMAAARACRGTAIDGREVLLVEARRQFHCMTGRTMPAGPARALIRGASIPPTAGRSRTSQ